MNEQIRELVRTSHLDVYGLGKNRANWEEAIEAYTKGLLMEVLTICEEYGDAGKDGHYCADEISRRFLR